MTILRWQPGVTLAAPVYLDANIVVGYVVRNHPLYKKSVELLGHLLTQRCQLQISLLAVEESLWAIARLSYFELANQPSTALFSQGAFERWRDRIFAAHGDRFDAVGSMFEDLKNAGVQIDIVPNQTTDWTKVIRSTTKYIRQLKLTPADAAHLAVAEACAKTIATGDSDIVNAANLAGISGLTVLHVV